MHSPYTRDNQIGSAWRPSSRFPLPVERENKEKVESEIYRIGVDDARLIGSGHAYGNETRAVVPNR